MYKMCLCEVHVWRGFEFQSKYIQLGRLLCYLYGIYKISRLGCLRSRFYEKYVYGTSTLNQDLSPWNVGMVRDMDFSDAFSFNQDISYNIQPRCDGHGLNVSQGGKRKHIQLELLQMLSLWQACFPMHIHLIKRFHGT
jgi:hypothetical protein